MDIWLRDNPLSEYIRREVLLDVSFTAASLRTLDSISGESQTFALAAVTDGFLPNGDARNHAFSDPHFAGNARSGIEARHAHQQPALLPAATQL